MVNKLALSFFGLLVCFGLTVCSTAAAQHSHCASCGCAEKPLSKVCLVKSYKQVSIPDYTCTSQETFYPQKGMVLKQRNQADTFIVQRKNLRGELCLCCESKTGCECNAGACPDGRHQTTSVRQPVGSTLHWVPVVQWKKVKCCRNCGAVPVEHLVTELPTIELPPIVPAKDAAANPGSAQPAASDK
jgi:hypothetical protein